MNWVAPPVLGGKPMPMIEPMLAAADEVMTPSSKHLAVSSASMNSSRSFMSWSGICSSATGNSRASPAQTGAPAGLVVLVEAGALEP